ncbi:hypothetical protein Rs2_34976 [Raphanus sativus]|nr:hypothetical protein Rs2_34976 [Raphanus sativus]
MGISRKQIREVLAKGEDIVFKVVVVDDEGGEGDAAAADKLRCILGDSAVIVSLQGEREILRFIDWEEVEEETRMLIKGGRIDSQEERLVRVATRQLRCVNYDYVVVSVEGRLEDAVNGLESIIDSEKCKVFPWVFEA